MPDIPCDGGVHVFLCAPGRSEGGRPDVRVHGAAVPDMGLDAVPAGHISGLPAGDEGGVQQDAAVIQPVMRRQCEPQGIAAGQHDPHPAGRKDVRQQGSTFDEIRHPGDLIQKDVPAARLLQVQEIPVHIGEGVPGCQLKISGPGQILAGHLSQSLPDQGGFAGPAQTVQDEHPVRAGTVQILTEPAEAVPLPEPRRRGGKCLKFFPCTDGCQECVPGRRGGLSGDSSVQLAQLLLQGLPAFDLSPQFLRFRQRHISFVPLPVLAPPVTEILTAVHFLCHN